jgi:hypothetical protein
MKLLSNVMESGFREAKVVTQLCGCCVNYIRHPGRAVDYLIAHANLDFTQECRKINNK